MIELDFSKGEGLLPAIAQDHVSGRVLMLAYISKESWEKTLETGEVHYWSRLSPGALAQGRNIRQCPGGKGNLCGL